MDRDRLEYIGFLASQVNAINQAKDEKALRQEVMRLNDLLAQSKQFGLYYQPLDPQNCELLIDRLLRDTSIRWFTVAQMLQQHCGVGREFFDI